MVEPGSCHVGPGHELADRVSMAMVRLNKMHAQLAHHMAKMDRYARWGAEELYQRGRRAGVADLVLRPGWRFLKAYFIGGSILDGRFGLVTSLL